VPTATGSVASPNAPTFIPKVRIDPLGASSPALLLLEAELGSELCVSVVLENRLAMTTAFQCFPKERARCDLFVAIKTTDGLRSIASN
jgi:hypothetical protein